LFTQYCGGLATPHSLLCFSTGTCLCYHNRAIWTGARVAQPTVKQHQFKKNYKIELADLVIHYCATVMQTKFGKIL